MINAICSFFTKRTFITGVDTHFIELSVCIESMMECSNLCIFHMTIFEKSVMHVKGSL